MMFNDSENSVFAEKGEDISFKGLVQYFLESRVNGIDFSGF